METREALLGRRSIRRYKSDPISPSDLKEILEAGMYAPSAINLLANRIVKTDGLINTRIDFSAVPEMVVQCAEYPYQYNKIVVNID